MIVSDKNLTPLSQKKLAGYILLYGKGIITNKLQLVTKADELELWIASF